MDPLLIPSSSPSHPTPSYIIETEIRKFFHDYKSSLPFVPFIQDENEFFLMRKQIMGQSTPQQSQVANDITNVIINNEQIDQPSIEPHLSKYNTDKTKIDHKNRLILHYSHEKRLPSTKRDIHKIYDNVFGNTPAMYVKMMVASRNHRTATNGLIRKKPLKSLLRNKSFKSKPFFIDQIRMPSRCLFHHSKPNDFYSVERNKHKNKSITDHTIPNQISIAQK
jgi:hypothetical protein